MSQSSRIFTRHPEQYNIGTPCHCQGCGREIAAGALVCIDRLVDEADEDDVRLLTHTLRSHGITLPPALPRPMTMVWTVALCTECVTPPATH